MTKISTMKTISLTALFLVALLVTAFSIGKDPVATTVKTGKYGVCGGDTINPTIELNLRKDSTFRYYSTNYIEGVADCDGKWKVEKGAVVLYDYESKVSIPEKWKISEDGNCLKGKMMMGAGFMMLSVCHLPTCSTK